MTQTALRLHPIIGKKILYVNVTFSIHIQGLVNFWHKQTTNDWLEIQPIESTIPILT